MMFLGLVEFRGGDEPGYDGLVEPAGFAEFFHRGLGESLLPGAVIKNGGAILCADVGALAIEGGRVVDFPEDFEQVLERDLSRVVDYFDGFGVACFVGADVFVSRIFEAACRVTD